MHTYRPHVHFSPKANWLNDPNGLVFLDGEYHLFFQYYPHDDVWGPMHWGHAVSRDLLHWEELDVALAPYDDTMIFSGSAVIDVNNTTGFGYGPDGQPPLLAIYTSHYEKEGVIVETQSLAYSHDKGRTFAYYAGNPVLADSTAKDFRDPKVFWYAPGGYWVLTLVAGDHVQFFKSPNLIEWELLSAFGKEHGSHGGVWECPDLFELDGHWVLLVSVIDGGPNGGSATQYFVGDFDGTTFTCADEPTVTKWVDYGTDNYAGVTWINNPDGRKLFIGWMNNWPYARLTPSVGFRGTMTIPRELRLVDGRLVQQPVRELLAQVTPVDTLQADAAHLVTVRGQAVGTWTIKLGHGDALATVVTFDPEKEEVRFDRTQGSTVDFFADFGKVVTAPYRVDASGQVEVQLLLDASSVELILEDGRTWMTNQLFAQGYETIEVAGDIQHVEVSIQVWRR
jgi:fructan beta-fructosidase